MSQRARTEVPYVAGLAVGLAFLWSSGMGDRTLALLGANDFSEYWTIARTLLEGGDPYDAASLRAFASRYATQVNLDTAAVQTPWIAFAMVPLALFNVRLANLIWLALGAAVAVLGLRALLRAYAPDFPVAHVAAGAALFGAPSSLYTVYAGQWTLFLTGALAWSIAHLASRRQASAAAWTLVALAKPHLFLFTGWALFATAHARGLRRYTVVLAALAGAIVFAAWIALPHWWDAWRRAVPSAVLTDPPNASNVATLLFEMRGPAGLYLAAALLIGAVVIGLTFARGGDAHLAYWTALSPLAAPYTRGYDLTLFAVPIVVAAGVLRRRSPRLASIVALGAFALLTLGALAVWPLNPMGSGSAKSLVGLAIFLLIAASLWPGRAQGRGDVAR